MTGRRRNPAQRPKRRSRRRIRRLPSQQQVVAKEGGGTEQGDHRTATQTPTHLPSPPGDYDYYSYMTHDETSGLEPHDVEASTIWTRQVRAEFLDCQVKREVNSGVECQRLHRAFVQNIYVSCRSSGDMVSTHLWKPTLMVCPAHSKRSVIWS